MDRRWRRAQRGTSASAHATRASAHATRAMLAGETSTSANSVSPIRQQQRIGRRRRRGERLIVVDGANVMFEYTKKLTGPTKPLVASTRGLELCFEHWMKMPGEDLDVVAFVPADLVEGPLWRVADGSVSSCGGMIHSLSSSPSAVSIVKEDVFSARGSGKGGESDGEGTSTSGIHAHLYRNNVLDTLIAEGKVRVVKDFFRWSRTAFPGWPEYDARGSLVRFHDVLPFVRTQSRSRDDIAVIRHARENDGFCLTNDRFEDHRHVMGKYCGKGTRKWIQRRRIEFSFERWNESSSSGIDGTHKDGLYRFVPHATPVSNKKTSRLIARTHLYVPRSSCQ